MPSKPSRLAYYITGFPDTVSKSKVKEKRRAEALPCGRLVVVPTFPTDPEQAGKQYQYHTGNRINQRTGSTGRGEFDTGDIVISNFNNDILSCCNSKRSSISGL